MGSDILIVDGEKISVSAVSKIGKIETGSHYTRYVIYFINKSTLEVIAKHDNQDDVLKFHRERIRLIEAVQNSKNQNQQPKEEPQPCICEMPDGVEYMVISKKEYNQLLFLKKQIALFLGKYKEQTEEFYEKNKNK